MSFYNNVEGVSVGFETCPITGENASYNFRTSLSYDGFFYQIPSLNPNTVVALHYSLMSETDYQWLAQRRERIKQRIIDTRESLFYIDRILVEELRRF